MKTLTRCSFSFEKTFHGQSVALCEKKAILGSAVYTNVLTQKMFRTKLGKKSRFKPRN